MLKLGKIAIARTSSAGNPITTASVDTDAFEKVLVLLIKTTGATNRAGGSPTYGGVALTQASTTQKAVTSPEASAEIWYLLDPAVGPATLSIPNTGAATLYYTVLTIRGSSSTNGKVTLDGASGGNATSTNPTPGAVVLDDYGCFGVAITAGGWTSWAPSAQVGTIIANTDDGAHGGGEQYIQNVGPGSHTLSWTFGTSDDWGAVSAYFTEVPANTFQNYMAADVTGDMGTGERIK